jgi:hypothetical protein
MDDGERAFQIVVRVELAQNRDKLRAFVNMMMNIFHKSMEFPDM